MGEINRRQLLELAAGAAAPHGLFVAEDDGVIPARDALDHIDTRIGQITAAYERAPIEATAVYLRRHLPVVRSSLADGGHRAEVERRLHRAAGRLCALWATTRHDLGDDAGAGQAYLDAFEHAGQAQDRSLQAWVRLWQSSLARKGGRLDNALQLARDAAAHVGDHSPAAGRAAAIEARVLGAMGERAGVHLAINRAWRIEGLLTDEQKGDPGFSIDTLHALTLAELSSAAYIELGQTDAARVYTEASIRQLDLVGATGLQSMARIAAATVELHHGDVDRAETLVTESLDISARRPNAVVSRRTDRFLADAHRRLGRRPATEAIAARLDSWRPPVARPGRLRGPDPPTPGPSDLGEPGDVRSGRLVRSTAG